MEEKELSQKIEELKILINEFSTRSNSDLYSPSVDYIKKYHFVYSKLKAISEELNFLNIQKYDGLDTLLKKYMSISDQIFNSRNRRENNFTELETKLTDLEVFLIPQILI